MAKLRADKRNYKKAFTTHANSYDNWNIGSPNSQRLLLCYCVECGLKCLIMQNDNIYTIPRQTKTQRKLLVHTILELYLRKLIKPATINSNSFQRNTAIM